MNPDDFVYTVVFMFSGTKNHAVILRPAVATARQIIRTFGFEVLQGRYDEW